MQFTLALELRFSAYDIFSKWDVEVAGKCLGMSTQYFHMYYFVLFIFLLNFLANFTLSVLPIWRLNCWTGNEFGLCVCRDECGCESDIRHWEICQKDK